MRELTLAASVLVLAVTAAASHAAPITTTLYQTDFEAPAFTAGNIVGQNSWTATTGGGAVNISAAAGAAHGGSQFALYNTANATNTATSKFAWEPVNATAASLAATPLLSASVFVAIANSTTARTAVAGLDLYNIAGSRIAAINFGTDGAVLALDPSGPVTPTATVTASLGSYHKLRILVDYTTQKVNYLFDGTLFATSTATTATDFGDGDLYAIRTSNPAGSSGGYNVAWDDLNIEASGVTPEPASLAALVGVANIALGRRRSRG